MSDEHKPLTDEELAAIETRAEKATPGPWRWEYPNLEELRIDDPDIREGDVTPYLVTDGVPDADPVLDDICDPMVGIEDAAFIAHARQDIPRLLAEVRRLRARNHEIQERADKRYAELEKQWRGWQECLARADKMLKAAGPDVVLHSAAERALVASLVQAQREGEERERRLQERMCILLAWGEGEVDSDQALRAMGEEIGIADPLLVMDSIVKSCVRRGVGLVVVPAAARLASIHERMADVTEAEVDAALEGKEAQP